MLCKTLKFVPESKKQMSKEDVLLEQLNFLWEYILKQTESTPTYPKTNLLITTCSIEKTAIKHSGEEQTKFGHLPIYFYKANHQETFPTK